jgi:uncharacterized protein YidB (DUF937 family)
MGLLDDLLAGLAGAQAGTGQSMGRRPQAQAPGQSGGMRDLMVALLPVVLALLANRSGGGDPRAGLGQRGGSPSGGGLGDLINIVLGGGGSPAGAGGAGGLAEILARFQRAGFGQQSQSWVSRGQNIPIPPEALEQVFGQAGVAEIARRVGASESDTRSALSQLLPEVVDRVTPQGDVPDFDALTASVDDLTQRYGRS